MSCSVRTGLGGSGGGGLNTSIGTVIKTGSTEIYNNEMFIPTPRLTGKYILQGYALRSLVGDTDIIAFDAIIYNNSANRACAFSNSNIDNLACYFVETETQGTGFQINMPYDRTISLTTCDYSIIKVG